MTPCGIQQKYCVRYIRYFQITINTGPSLSLSQTVFSLQVNTRLGNLDILLGYDDLTGILTIFGSVGSTNDAIGRLSYGTFIHTCHQARTTTCCLGNGVEAVAKLLNKHFERKNSYNFETKVWIQWRKWVYPLLFLPIEQCWYIGEGNGVTDSWSGTAFRWFTAYSFKFNLFNCKSFPAIITHIYRAS